MLDELNAAIEGGRAAFIRAANAVAARQIDRLVELAAPLVEAQDADKVGNLSAPYKAEMADALGNVLTDLYRRGYDSVVWERRRQTGRTVSAVAMADPVVALPFLLAKARASAQMAGVRLVAALVWEALDQIKTGVPDMDALRRVMEALSERELGKAAAVSVGEAVNLGRRDAAKEFEDEIDRAQYSAILDRRVCAVCEGLDGLEVTLDDPRYEEYMPPNPECLGGDRCRCVWILIFKEEKRARVQ